MRNFACSLPPQHPTMLLRVRGQSAGLRAVSPAQSKFAFAGSVGFWAANHLDGFLNILGLGIFYGLLCPILEHFLF